MKDCIRRKGFTLFEVLVTVILIVTISSAIFLSSTEMSESTDAAKIIADFDAIRKAVQSWYADNRETFKEMHRNNK